MNMLGQEVRTPLVIERSAFKKIVVAGAGTRTTVLENVSSIHGVYVDLLLKATVNLSKVELVFWGAAKQVSYTVQVSGALAAGTNLGIRYGGSGALATGEPIGDTFDVVVTNAVAGAGTTTAWVAVRS